MPYISPSGSGIQGLDVQEGGVTVLDPATALNFDSDDFAVTDEGGGVAGIALDATLFAGTYLAIDGSNRMQFEKEIRTLGGILDFETEALPSTVTEEFSGSTLNLGNWVQTQESSTTFVTLSVTGGYYYFETILDYTPTGSDKFDYIQSLWTLQGDFDLAFRVEINNVDDQCPILDAFVAGSANWPDGVNPPLATDRASLSIRYLGSPVHVRTLSGAITNTSGTSVSSFPSDAVWWRFTRVGTTITTYYNTADAGSDTVPGSWTTFQTKASAGLSDEVRIGFRCRQVQVGETAQVGTWAKVYRAVVTSADTVNASGLKSTGWQMIVDDDIVDGGAVLDLTYNTSVKALQALSQTDGIDLRIFDDVGTTYAYFAIDDAQSLRIGLAGASPAGYISILSNIIQVGGIPADFIIARDAGETGGNTAKIGVPEDSRRLIIADQGDVSSLTDSGLAARIHPTITIMDATYAENIDLFHDGTDAQLDLSTGNVEYSRAGTPVGYLGVVRQRTGSDWAAGTLTDEVDIGLRADPPEDYLSVNMAGAFFKIGFGACAAFACIYNEGTGAGQALTVAGGATKCNQFTTNFGTDRSAVADAANDRITFTETGIYLVILAFSFTADTNAVTLDILGYVGGVHAGQLHGERKVQTANDYGFAGFSGLVSATAGQQLEVYLLVDGDSTVTTDECSLSAVRVG